MEIRMDLSRIIIRENDDQQIIYLRERDGERQFPIVIGYYEALAINRRIKGVVSARPMTHDLLTEVITAMHGELERVVIHDLQDHTFYAKLVIRSGGEMVEVDARPSDAIAVGVASDTPLYVSEAVLEKVC